MCRKHKGEKYMKKDNAVLLKYFGNRFQTIREESGISRDMAAEMIGISKRTLASYERGEREMNIDTAKRMAIAYKTTISNLTNYKNVLNEACK